MADSKSEYLSHLWKSCLNWALNSSLNLPGIKKGAQASPERRDSLGKGSEVGGSMVCVSGSIFFTSGSASRPCAERLHSAVGFPVGHGLVKYLGTRTWV